MRFYILLLLAVIACDTAITNNSSFIQGKWAANSWKAMSTYSVFSLDPIPEESNELDQYFFNIENGDQSILFHDNGIYTIELSDSVITGKFKIQHESLFLYYRDEVLAFSIKKSSPDSVLLFLEHSPAIQARNIEIVLTRK